MTDTQTPERIWHAFDRRGKISGCPDAHVEPCSEVAEAYQEYVHADLYAAVVAERDQLKAKLTELEKHRA